MALALVIAHTIVSCKTTSTSGSEVLETQAIINENTSCSATVYEFQKNYPIYLRNLARYTQETSGSWRFPEASSCSEMSRTNTWPSFRTCLDCSEESADRCIRSSVLPQLPQPTDRNRLETTKYTYLQTLRTRLEKLKARWEGEYGRRCTDAQLRYEEDVRRTEIVDFPACLVACRVQRDQCTTCSFRMNARDRSDPTKNGKITCDSEEDARQAVKDWCQFKGVSCNNEDITCQSGSTSPSSSTSQVEGDGAETLTKFVRFSRTGQAQLGVDIPGISAGTRTAYTMTGTARVLVTIQGFNDRAFDPVTDKGTGYATFKCSAAIEDLEVGSQSTNLKLSLGVASAGGEAVVELGDSKLVNFSSKTVSAAGQTRSQILDYCATYMEKVWSQKLLDNRLILRVAIDRAAPKNYQFAHGHKVFCKYKANPRKEFWIIRFESRRNDDGVLSFRYSARHTNGIEHWLGLEDMSYWYQVSEDADFRKRSYGEYSQGLVTGRFSSRWLADLIEETASYNDVEDAWTPTKCKHLPF